MEEWIEWFWRRWGDPVFRMHVIAYVYFLSNCGSLLIWIYFFFHAVAAVLQHTVRKRPRHPTPDLVPTDAGVPQPIYGIEVD